MNRPDVFSPAFNQALIEMKVNTRDLSSAIERDTDIRKARKESPQPEQVVHEWTGLSRNVAKNGLWDSIRDEKIPTLQEAATTILQPWKEAAKKAEIDEIPPIQVKELVRKTGMSADGIIDTIQKGELKVAVNGTVFVADVLKPLPNDKSGYTLADARKLGISGQTILQGSRYFSRPPGGGPAQKIRIDEGKINGQVQDQAREKTLVRFVPNTITSSNEFEGKIVPKTELEDVFDQADDPEAVKYVFDFLKKDGLGKNWVLGGNEAAFAKTLVEYSQGQPTDFLVWNCIGFSWFDENGAFPSCDIDANENASMAIYYKDKMQQIAETLALIGNPKITILVPSNEAFDDRLWTYRQTEAEREQVVNATVNTIQNGFSDIAISPNTSISVMRWDEYLVSKGIAQDQLTYSNMGEAKVSANPDIEKMKKDAVKKGKRYYADSGITNIRDAELANGQIRYFGVYAGEGIAYNDIKEQTGTTTVLLNFEEMTVGKMTLLGSEGKVSVITPVTDADMKKYYGWKKSVRK